jgi:hypothetical protein
MPQALRLLPSHFISINARQCLEKTWLVRPARNGNAMIMSHSASLLTDPFRDILSVRHRN